MKIKKLLIPMFALILVFAVAMVSVFAYIHRQREIEGRSQIGTAKVVSVINGTNSQKVMVAEGNHTVNISAILECNIDATMRVKIAPKFYDQSDRLVIMPNNITYNFDNTLASWIADENNMCFYLVGLVKNIENVKLINSISFDSNTLNEYEEYSVELVVEVDILQHKAVDYNNHPWKDNAPTSWLEIVKDL